MRYLILVSFLSILAGACKNENTSAPQKAVSEVNHPAPAESAPSPEATAAQQAGKASASTAQNLATGYWHIGGGINLVDRKDKGYVGEWIKFEKDQRFTYGKGETDIFKGAWVFDETNEYITFQSNEQKEAFFLYQFQCKQIGDIILLLGNTPNNPKGMQLKLVREDSKVIEHNPN